MEEEVPGGVDPREDGPGSCRGVGYWGSSGLPVGRTPVPPPIAPAAGQELTFEVEGFLQFWGTREHAVSWGWPQAKVPPKHWISATHLQ